MAQKTLKTNREKAFVSQNGLCHYCGHKMWDRDPVRFCKEFGLTLRQAAVLRCTAEHLCARQDGGKNSSSNIVAACQWCNQHRHKRRVPLDPEQYKAHVSQRMSKGKWLP